MSAAAGFVSVAKQAGTLFGKLWIKLRPLKGDTALGMAEVVEAATSGLFERRALTRQLDQVGDRIAKKLEPFIESEFRDLPEGEVTAAIELVGDVLREAEISNATLASADADPRLVESDVRESSQELIENAYLSDSAMRLFDLLLREATDYIVELVAGLPPFNSAAAQEMLRRETVLATRVDEILEQMPQTPQFLGGTAKGAAAVFEMKYKRAMLRRFNQLELFGLDLVDRRPYTLSVAYITLSVQRSLDGVKEEEGAYVTASQALAGMPRALIVGEAGSGKTTLLQWLAVQACRGELADDLPEWDNLIPFFIPLRRSVDTELPSPEDFVGSAASSLAGVMPQGWVHDQLSSGRGLVLVDGVDELPPSKRDEVRKWLDELVATFPESRFVVTSRPPAVGEGWLEAQAFDCAELQPMNFADIASFIQHWHEASLDGTEDEAERTKVAARADDLIGQVQKEPAVKSLATSPLLCAMLCALHRDRKRKLPQGRLEIYRAALDSLIERRDVEREVAHGLPAQSLSLPQKKVLLRDLAYWLMRNGYTDASIEDCRGQVAKKLRLMRGVDYSGEQVLDYLLIRSGVLREPIPGRVDFLHRTFQEYLAAREVIEHSDIGRLVSDADSDEWGEVVVLAAGQAQLDQREELIRQLIDRGNQDPALATRMYLLAVACLDASVELSPELAEEVHSILERIIPPRTLTEANALVSAGDLAVPLLADGWKDQSVRTTAACVRALGLIGGDLALDTLAEIAPDDRVTVGKELARMWDEFDADVYAERVLAKSPRFAGEQLWLPPDHAHLTRHLKGLAGLRIGYPSFDRHGARESFPLESLAECTSLERLQVYGPVGSVDAAVFPSLPALRSLSLRRCGAVESFEKLGEVAQLEELGIELTELDSVSFLRAIEGLRSLTLIEIGDELDLWPVGDLFRLESLTIEGTADTSGANIFEALKELRELTLSDTNVVQPDAIGGLKELRALSVEAPLRSLARLFQLPQLTYLSIGGGEFEELEIAGESGLERLLIANADRLQGIHDIRHCAKLRQLSIVNAPNVVGIAALAECRSLTALSLVETAVSDLTPLKDADGLERVDLRGTLVEDFSPLASLGRLRVVSVDEDVSKRARSQLPGVRVRSYPIYLDDEIRAHPENYFPTPASL